MTYVEARRKELKTKWPVTEGIVAGTTKQTGRQMNLLPQGILGIKTRVFRKERKGIS